VRKTGTLVFIMSQAAKKHVFCKPKPEELGKEYRDEKKPQTVPVWHQTTSLSNYRPSLSDKQSGRLTEVYQLNMATGG